MQTPVLDRRSLLWSGAAAAGVAAFPGWKMPPEASGVRSKLQASAVLARLVVGKDGGSHTEVVEFDRSLTPLLVTRLASFPPLSLAAAARRSRDEAMGWVAHAWDVPPAQCAWNGRLIKHDPSGRSLPAALWTDFA